MHTKIFIPFFAATTAFWAAAHAQTCDPKPHIESVTVLNRVQIPAGALSALGEVHVVIDGDGNCPDPSAPGDVTLIRDVTAIHDGMQRRELILPKSSKAVQTCAGCREYVYDVRFWQGENQLQVHAKNAAGEIDGATSLKAERQAAAGFYAAADPDLVAPFGGTVLLSAGAFDAQGQPLRGQRVEWLQYGQLSQYSQTDAQGMAYVLAQCKAQGMPDCGFSARIQGQQDIPIPVTIAQFQVEAFANGQPVQGVVNDPEAAVRLLFHATPNATVRLATPDFGRFLLENGQKREPLTQTTVKTNAQGDVALYYEPPAKLPETALTAELTLTKGSTFVAPQTLRFDIEKAGIPTIKLETPMMLAPASVALLPEFQGDLSTITPIQNALKAKKWRTVNPSDLSGASSRALVQDQTDNLKRLIETELVNLSTGAIKALRVDMVAFGVSGLVARKVIAESSALPLIRKLIMVGTPNHGLNLRSPNADPDPDFWAAFHTRTSNGPLMLAIDDLQSDAPFLTQLNAEERKGGHLHPQVEYALLLGERQSRTQTRRNTEDDGFVYAASAHLSGVKTETLKGAHHNSGLSSTSGFLDTIALGDTEALHQKVAELLQSPIARAPLDQLSIRLAYSNGDLYQGWQNPQLIASVPKDLAPFDTISTQISASAVIEVRRQKKPVASIILAPETRLQLLYCSPERLILRLHWGSVQIIELAARGGLVSVEIPENQDTNHPQVRYVALKPQSEFIVEALRSSNAVYLQKGLLTAFGANQTASKQIQDGQNLQYIRASFENASVPDNLYGRFLLRNMLQPEAAEKIPEQEAPTEEKNVQKCDYMARLSSEDHFSAKGVKLTQATAILLRDRVNVAADRGDPEDQKDAYLVTPEARTAFAALLKAQPLDPAVERSILQGTPLIRVQLYGDHYVITVIDGAVAAPAAKPAKKPSATPKPAPAPAPSQGGTKRPINKKH